MFHTVYVKQDCAHFRYVVETEDKTKNKRSPQGNSKDWGAPQAMLCTKSMGEVLSLATKEKTIEVSTGMHF